MKTERYYIVSGRMQSGSNIEVPIELFLNGELRARKYYFVTKNVNASKMAIGQERDATNHPGFESFDGEITRFLIYDRPLSDSEMQQLTIFLKNYYNFHN
ncbi:hypothetical protein VOI54_14530 [Tamlana sp. 2201CG12-4]|uniref:hypothetical protein n=1 Tax=Tamlana sp. 2201CG12-4 TaxID=3112582 RepID=UPI002DBA4AAD|nr:hypothetical protein [Tamlana sp. 2201CG12-4]MEC3908242.1 hypothetical protein [Tamlana sp. 2201CG12-4]